MSAPTITPMVVMVPTSLARASFGSQPEGMSDVVMLPQAIKVAMLGMTMLLKKRPTF